MAPFRPFRRLRRHPTTVIVSIVVLGAAVGMVTTVFSIVRAVQAGAGGVLRAEGLTFIRATSDASVNLEAIRGVAAPAFEGVAAHRPMDVVVHSPTGQATVLAEIVSPNYFSVVGQHAALGRTLGEIDVSFTNSTPAVVLSDYLWRVYFNASSSILDDMVTIEGARAVVVGVMPVGFNGLSDALHPTRLWMTAEQYYGRTFRPFSSFLIGRLRNGINAERGRAALGRLVVAGAGAARTASFSVSPVRDVPFPFERREQQRVTSRLAVGALALAVVVLAIAVVNVSGVLLARAQARAKTVAIHRALGAGSVRLLWEELSEAGTIGLASCCVGLVVSAVLLQIYASSAPAAFRLAVSPDASALVFTVSLGVFAGISAGLAPAVMTLRFDGGISMSELGPFQGRRGLPRTLRRWVVGPQVALAAMLLVVAASHLKPFIGLNSSEKRFVSSGIAVLTIRQRPEDGRSSNALESRRFFRTVLDAARSSPGVRAVAQSSVLPIGTANGMRYYVSRDAPPGAAGVVVGRFGYVSSGYFDTLQLPMIAGRDFTDADGATGAPAVIVSESVASALWPRQAPIGRWLGHLTPGRSTAEVVWKQVIGVSRDLGRQSVEDLGRGEFVLESINQIPLSGGYHLELLAALGSESKVASESLRRAVVTADDSVELTDTRSLDERAASAGYARRVAATLAGTTGAVGLFLAGVGLYGTLSYLVLSRLRELGIRSMLGASRLAIVSMILREGVINVTGSAALGALMGACFLPFTSDVLGGITVRETAVASVAAMGVALLLVVAACGPAWRAGRVDPLAVLRGTST